MVRGLTGPNNLRDKGSQRIYGYQRSDWHIRGYNFFPLFPAALLSSFCCLTSQKCALSPVPSRSFWSHLVSAVCHGQARPLWFVTAKFRVERSMGVLCRLWSLRSDKISQMLTASASAYHCCLPRVSVCIFFMFAVM